METRRATVTSLQWRHTERDSVSNNRRLDYSLNRLFRRRSTKISTFRVTGLCEGNSPVPVIIYVIFYLIGPRFNGTRLYDEITSFMPIHFIIYANNRILFDILWRNHVMILPPITACNVILYCILVFSIVVHHHTFSNCRLISLFNYKNGMFMSMRCCKNVHKDVVVLFVVVSYTCNACILPDAGIYTITQKHPRGIFI